MINTVRRIPALRYGLIVLLTLILSIIAFYLYIHYTKAEAVRYNFSKVIQSRGNADLIDSCILELFKAENNSRLYAITKDEDYYREFSKDIKFVSSAIHRINAKGKHGFDTFDQKFEHLLTEKSNRTNNYFKLIAITDSLLGTAKKMNAQTHEQEAKKLKAILIREISFKMKTDSIQKTLVTVLPKRKFFSRIFSAFSKKKSAEQLLVNQSKSMVVVERKVDSIIRNTAFNDQSLAVNSKNYKELFALNLQMKSNEQELLTINTQLINRIIMDLRKYKLEEQAYINNSNIILDGNLQEVLYDYKKISTLFFLLLTLTVILVLYNVWKIFKNEEKLMTYTVAAEKDSISKTTFLANMSHEIRTPLNSVIGFSEQLMDSQLNRMQAEQVKAISSSSKMLLDVVNEILEFSKYETGKMNFESNEFKPYSALMDVFSSIRILAENKGLILDQKLDINHHLLVKGDQVRLKQVVINLLNNAIKFTSKGTITLSAGTVVGHDGSILLRVEVEDSGVGIAKENLAYIFDEFTQVASAQKRTHQKGTGLGLAICKRIIELQGGEISVRSEAGKGSVFRFELGYQLAESTEKHGFIDRELHKPAHQSLAGKHVLVADDNELNLLLVSTILRKWHITYDTAKDGREALSLFEQNEYDLLLTDIEMPVMGGMELSRFVRAFHDHKSLIPILALTANAMKEDTEKYVTAGMNGVIVKPFSESNFLLHLEKALIG